MTYKHETPTILLTAVLGFIGIIDTAFMVPVIAAYAKTLGADAALAGLIAGFYSMVAIPASFLIGFLIDFIGRKRALLLAFLSDAVVVYLYSLAANPMQLLAVRGLHAVGGSITFPAILALVGDLTKYSMGRTSAVFWMSVGGALAVGTFSAGFLASQFGFRMVFQVLSVVLTAGFLLSLFAPETLHQKSKPQETLVEIGSSMRQLAPSYISIYALYYVFGVVTGILTLTLINVQALTVERAVAVAGLYFGLSSTVALGTFYFFGILADRDRYSFLFIVGLPSAALSQLLLLYSSTFRFVLASSVALGFAISAIYVVSTVIAASTSQTSRGTSFGIQQTFNILGVATGAPLSGIILKIFGSQMPYIAGATVPLAALAGILLCLKSYIVPINKTEL